jgi:hypothetical protein
MLARGATVSSIDRVTHGDQSIVISDFLTPTRATAGITVAGHPMILVERLERARFQRALLVFS